MDKGETEKRRRCILAKCPELDTGNPKCAICTGPVAIRNGSSWSFGRARSCHGCRMDGLGLAVCWACCPGPNSGFQTDGQSIVHADSAESKDELIAHEAERQWLAERYGIGGAAASRNADRGRADGDAAMNAVVRALRLPSAQWDGLRPLVAAGDGESMRMVADAIGVARGVLVRRRSKAREAIARLAEIGGADWEVLRARMANANVSGAAGMFGVTKQAVSKREIAMRGRVAWYDGFLKDLLSADKPFFSARGVITPTAGKRPVHTATGYEQRVHPRTRDAEIVSHPKSGCQD